MTLLSAPFIIEMKKYSSYQICYLFELFFQPFKFHGDSGKNRFVRQESNFGAVLNFPVETCFKRQLAIFGNWGNFSFGFTLFIFLKIFLAISSYFGPNILG